MSSKTFARRNKAGAHGLGFWWTFAAGLVAFGALIVAIVQNGRHVRLHYLAWHVNVSLIVVILTTALVAVFLDEAGGLIWRHRRRGRLGRHSELEQLRADAQEAPAAPDADPGAHEISPPTQQAFAVTDRPVQPR